MRLSALIAAADGRSSEATSEGLARAAMLTRSNIGDIGEVCFQPGTGEIEKGAHL
jgi:hypothetical protein